MARSFRGKGVDDLATEHYQRIFGASKERENRLADQIGALYDEPVSLEDWMGLMTGSPRAMRRLVRQGKVKPGKEYLFKSDGEAEISSGGEGESVYFPVEGGWQTIEDMRIKLQNPEGPWIVRARPDSCDKCKAMDGKIFMQYPVRPHPNCKCVIERYPAVRSPRPEEEPRETIVARGRLNGSLHSFSQFYANNGDIRIECNNELHMPVGVEIFANGKSDHAPLGPFGKINFIFNGSSPSGVVEWRVNVVANHDYGSFYYVIFAENGGIPG